MATDQIDRLPAYQVLADHLRQEITSGVLRPGDRLPTEPELSTRMGLSRSTIREALRLLASQNLIVTTRGVTGGSFVAEPNAVLLGEMLSTGLHMLMSAGTVSGEQWLEVRETFEVPAACMAARRRTEAQLAAMEATLFDPDRAPLETIVAADLAFHRLMGEATGNPLYELIIKPLYSMTNCSDVGARAPAGFWQRIDAEHRMLLRAISAQDVMAAGEAARAHVQHVRNAYTELDVQLRLG